MGSPTANTLLSCQRWKNFVFPEIDWGIAWRGLGEAEKGESDQVWMDRRSLCKYLLSFLLNFQFTVFLIFRWDASWTFGALCFSFASPGSWVSVALVSKATSHYGVGFGSWFLLISTLVSWASPLAPGWVANRQVVLSQEGEGAIWSQLASSLTWWKLCPVKVLPSGLGWHALSSKPWPRKVVRSSVAWGAQTRFPITAPLYSLLLLHPGNFSLLTR